MIAFKWLIPGMQVKRWLVLLLAGTTLLALAIAYLLIDVYRTVELPPGSPSQTWLSLLTMQFLPQWARALLFAAGGVTLIALGLYGLGRSLIDAERSARSGRLLEKVDRRRRRRSDTKIVAIGGGTGLSTMLRGLKLHTSNITAIVTVADDGGSSGRLRESLGVHPPGDFRQCIAALADTEPLMESLFQYRFGQGELGGHAFGNLFIVAMTGITGSFESALRASSRVLAVSGRIVPSTLEHVTLFAELADDQVMRGESRVPQGKAPIRRVFIEPAAPAAYPEAVAAILDADLVIIGPGSLYTSILPNLLVPDIVNAITATRAPVVYVANVATQPGETDGYSLSDHLRALLRHLPRDRAILDYVLANADTSQPLPADAPVTLVRPQLEPAGELPLPELVTARVVSPAFPTHHDPGRLAEAVVRLARRAG
ncbi:MAG: YvcK family protein [Chloroflexi bacterium]|nr:YvcK family protein [Chloroflexota bacterium]